jgi:hypothetical protein
LRGLFLIVFAKRKSKQKETIRGSRNSFCGGFFCFIEFTLKRNTKMEVKGKTADIDLRFLHFA